MDYFKYEYKLKKWYSSYEKDQEAPLRAVTIYIFIFLLIMIVISV